MERERLGQLCTVPEAARRSGLGLRQLRRAIETGEITTFQIGGWPRLRWAEVEKWLESHRCRSTGEPAS